MLVSGRARYEPRTKYLVRKLRPGELAVLDHSDLDEVAARAIVRVRARAVLNFGVSLTGCYPATGARVLLEAGIPILERLTAPDGSRLEPRTLDCKSLQICDALVTCGGQPVARGVVLSADEVAHRLQVATTNFADQLERFLENTLEHARLQKNLLAGRVDVPTCRTPMEGRHVLVVARGPAHREDLRAIRPYLDLYRPVLLGVDGGADALLDEGYRPHLIVGDMDSASDRALRSGAELVVHAYPDGHSPGLHRLQGLGLRATAWAVSGTSEDIAMLLAHAHGASPIVAVGTHSHMLDFLDKGRPGMASTLLVRSRLGASLVDAKGISRLYPPRPSQGRVAPVLLAAIVPIMTLAVLSVPAQLLLRLLFLQLRLRLGV
ncbi:MAG TPA: hypothetical protein DEQ28_02995 [Clostridiales bacterium]|nr:hypothetical protein [Clostridiales bacterium]